jgi:hypothetical protein
MISSLSDLVAPLSVPEFKDLLRQREPRLIRGSGAGRYAALLDWDGLMNAVLTGAYPARKLRLTKQGAPLPPLFYRSDGGPKAELVTQLMATGGSIVAYGIDPHVPAIGRLCAAIGEETGEHIVGSAIATTGSGGALDLHYDDTDIVILQVEGRKNWVIERDPVINPVIGLPASKGEDDAGIALDIELEPGDFLFVPGGYRHRCEARSARSLHLGFFFYPLTIPRTLDLLMRQAVQDVDARRPWRFEEAEQSAVEAALKRELVQQIDRLSLADLLAAHRATDMGPTRRN